MDVQLEQRFYANLYTIADVDKDGRISGQEGAIFLRRSGLHDSYLHQIWEMVDTKKQGFLMQRDFAIAMRLVSMAQQGLQPDISQIANVTKMPKFADIPIPTTLSTPLTEQEKYKYDNLFIQADTNKDNFVDGMEAKAYFGKANIPIDKLAIIWSLSDLDKDGKLNKAEFRISMHLMYWTLKGESLPISLPDSLVQSAVLDAGFPRGRALSAPNPSLISTIVPPLSSSVTPQTVAQPYLPQSMGSTYIPNLQVTQSTPLPTQIPNLSTPSSSQPTQASTKGFPTSNDPFGSFPTLSGDLIFTSSPSKHNYDQSKLTAQHTLPGATFEQRANFSSELQSAISKKRT